MRICFRISYFPELIRRHLPPLQCITERVILLYMETTEQLQSMESATGDFVEAMQLLNSGEISDWLARTMIRCALADYLDAWKPAAIVDSSIQASAMARLLAAYKQPGHSDDSAFSDFLHLKDSGLSETEAMEVATAGQKEPHA